MNENKWKRRNNNAKKAKIKCTKRHMHVQNAAIISFVVLLCCSIIIIWYNGFYLGYWQHNVQNKNRLKINQLIESDVIIFGICACLFICLFAALFCAPFILFQLVIAIAMYCVHLIQFEDDKKAYSHCCFFFFADISNNFILYTAILLLSSLQKNVNLPKNWVTFFSEVDRKRSEIEKKKKDLRSLNNNLFGYYL